MADTSVYAQSILRHQHGAHTGYHRTTSNPFWDFGHLLWRPLGWLCFKVTLPLIQILAEQNQRAQILLTLLAVNFVAALTCVLCFFHWARQILGDDRAAFLASLGFFSADAFLNYAHAGTPYIVGEMFLVAGAYFLMEGDRRGKSLGSACMAGLMFGLAALFWVPYLFVLPAAVACPFLVWGYDRKRLRFAAQTLITCAVVGFAAYIPVMAVLGISNLSDFKAWVTAAGHGHMQPGGLRVILRLAFSVPRSFINMGQDGIWLKRYLVRDPYAPVSLADLLRLGWWKLLLFYGATALVVLRSLRSSYGRAMLFLLGLAILPIVVFAVLVFEAGSIERYLPLSPFVFLGFGYVLTDNQTKRYEKVLIVTIMVVTAIVNLNAMSRTVLEAQENLALARIRELIPMLGPNSVVIAINEQDSLAQFCQNVPLAPVNLNAQWTNYDVLEVNTSRVSTWREDFAERTLASWQHGGTVWLPVRLFRSVPKPEWNWVEGDDKRVRWTDLTSFFSAFDTGPIVSGDDGFVQLLHDPKNEKLILLASQSAMIPGRPTELPIAHPDAARGF